MGLKIKALMCGAAAFVLAACEAGETGGTNQANAYAFSDISDGLVSFQALSDASLAEAASFSNNLPSGSTNYDGIMSVSIDGTTDGVLGTIRLNVNFDNNGLSGSVGSFRNFSDQATPGSLNISGGTISPVGAALGTADVSGTIDFQAGTMSINETYIHQFRGPTGEYNIGAVIDGTAQPTVGGPVDITSAWTVERQ